MKLKTLENFFTKKGETPKKRGPKFKEKKERLSKIISFRISDDEYKILLSKAKNEGSGHNQTARRIFLNHL